MFYTNRSQVRKKYVWKCIRKRGEVLWALTILSLESSYHSPHLIKKMAVYGGKKPNRFRGGGLSTLILGLAYCCYCQRKLPKGGGGDRCGKKKATFWGGGKFYTLATEGFNRSIGRWSRGAGRGGRFHLLAKKVFVVGHQ